MKSNEPTKAKSKMKKTMRFLSLAALALVGAVLTGCSGSDDSIEDIPQQPAQTDDVVTLTTTVGLEGSAAARALTSGGEEGGATTRALTADGVKTFAAGEKMALLYTNTSGQTVVVPSEALTDVDIVTSDDPDKNKKSATFTFRLTEAPDKTKQVKYFYPAAMATNTNVNYDRLYSQQDGTLTKLASDFDAASSEYLDWDDDNLPGTTLTNRLAILAITLKDDVTGADITSSITSLILSVDDGTYTYNVSRSAAAGPIYVAIRRTATEEHNSGSDINVTASDGIFTYTKTLKQKKYYTGNFYNVGWRMTNTMQSVPLTMEALTDGTIVVKTPVVDMKYSVDGGLSRTDISHGRTTTISVNVGDKVQFYGNSNYYYASESSYNNIAGGTAQVKVYGNIMSLVNETDFATATTLTMPCTFASLFEGNTNLTDASGLLLPATTLSMSCYAAMFEYCTNLTIAPVLHAKTLVTSCYYSMFYGCHSLCSVTCLATDISASSCTSYWLYGVAASGTFTTPSTTNWLPNADGIPNGWTRLDY